MVVMTAAATRAPAKAAAAHYTLMTRHAAASRTLAAVRGSSDVSQRHMARPMADARAPPACSPHASLPARHACVCVCAGGVYMFSGEGGEGAMGFNAGCMRRSKAWGHVTGRMA